MKMEVLDRKVRTRTENSTGNGFLTTKTVRRQPSHIITREKKKGSGFFGKVIDLLK